MLKLRFAPLAAIGLSATIALAQEPADPTPDAPSVQAEAKPRVVHVKHAPLHHRRIIAKATPVPVATPVPKPPGFWERVFGNGKKKPAPTPVPATPVPVIVKKKPPVKAHPKKRKVAETETDSTAKAPGKIATAKPEAPKPDVEKMPPAKSEENPKSSPPKTVKTKPNAGHAQDTPPSTDNPDAEVVEKQKYDQAKAKAAADPKVQELRGKADLANSEAESRKALRVYNKALFSRMKEIDPSIKDHVERMEAAVLSRLGE